MTLPNRYRPQNLTEIVGQPVDEIENRLRGRDTPNFLFYGPPGTGKTSAARCVADELLEDRGNAMELTAPDVGVDEIRERITRAARQMTLDGNANVIILDEMETMGYKAQQSLKKRMEDYPAVFILVTNDESLESINDALVDRCKEVHFSAVETDVIAAHVRAVAAEEGIDITDQKAESIASFANGSVRKALSKLSDEKPRSGNAEMAWGDGGRTRSTSDFGPTWDVSDEQADENEEGGDDDDNVAGFL